MRTRYKKYSDYFINKKRLEFLKAYCRTHTELSQLQAIQRAALEANPVIYRQIINNACGGLSYEKLTDIPYLKEDFYGYVRLFYAKLDELVP